MKHPRASKTASILPPSLQHQLNMYALAASAAGVSLLAVAQPSEAKIIYTKAHQVIGQNGVYELDLNHDGTIDFLIEQSSYALLAQEAFGNAVQGSVGYRWDFAAALNKGARIGRGQEFVHGRGEALVAFLENTSQSQTSGHWVNVKNGYLGLRFKIGGETHYGWARLSVYVVKGRGSQVFGILTGYAYETIPNKGIDAGHTDGTAEGSTAGRQALDSGTSGSTASADGPSLDIPLPSTIGRLALGAEPIPREGRTR
jgi:hypothetical protein